MTTPPAPPGSIPQGPVARRSHAAGWWRRNGWALAALPLVLALTVVAAGDRVRSFWWEQGLHRPTSVAAGETVRYHQDVRDGMGGTRPVDVEVRLDGVEDATVLPEDMELPAGTRAVEVGLTLGADPGAVLVGCFLAVRDEAGTRYDYVSSAWGGGQPVVPCVPEDATGPWPSLGEFGKGISRPEGEAVPRPATWSVAPVVVVPQDAEIVDVVLWWQMPQHVRLEVGR